METAVNNGTKLHLNTEVEEIVKKEDGFIVKTNQGDFETKIVISCAGTHAEEIASMVSKQVPY
ncbi:FAD/NAD(P)-binding oxidoreductase, partial [Acinetobacter baumannii]|nr:FAD/NAD(P)-binding oxidoreductase [Acinetobacter baumannii]